MYVLKLIAYAYCCLYELSCCLHIDLQLVYLYPGIWIWRNPYPQINVQASVYDLASKDCI